MTAEKLSNPYKRRLDKAAWEAGRVACAQGAGSDSCPHGDDASALARAWRKGWSDQHAFALEVIRVQFHAPPVTHRPVPPVSTRGLEFVVPDDEDLGERMVYVRPRPVPCPCCRRVRLDSTSPACVVQSSGPRGSGVVYLRCRACNGCARCGGRPFKVPAR